jgi:oxalate decarboxylase/phosphoglucose isomerase-like protein (cupin superfamily)
MIYHSHRWGYSEILFTSAEVCLARAVGVAGGASSLHTHRDKSNLFHVLHGFVEIYGTEGKIVTLDKHRHPVFVAPPGMVHRMVFQSDAILFEVYTAALNRTVQLDDIQRLDDGRYPEVLDREALGRLARDDPRLAVWIEDARHCSRRNGRRRH